MSKAKITLSLGEKVRLVNFLVDNKDRLQYTGIPDLLEIVKDEIGVVVGNKNLGLVYRTEAGYPKLRSTPSTQCALEARVAKLEGQIAKMETLWK